MGSINATTAAAAGCCTAPLVRPRWIAALAAVAALWRSRVPLRQGLAPDGPPRVDPGLLRALRHLDARTLQDIGAPQHLVAAAELDPARCGARTRMREAPGSWRGDDPRW